MFDMKSEIAALEVFLNDWQTIDSILRSLQRRRAWSSLVGKILAQTWLKYTFLLAKKKRKIKMGILLETVAANWAAIKAGHNYELGWFTNGDDKKESFQ